MFRLPRGARVQDYRASLAALEVLANLALETGATMACSLVLLVLASGCAGVFGFDGTSQSVGTHANGALRTPSSLPAVGDGYVIPPPWRERRSHFGSDELVGALVRATRSVTRVYPASVAAVGDLSRRGGGGSVEHRSHQSGRDVDIFYFATDSAGRSEPPKNVMFHFDKTGRAKRWSPPRGALSPRTEVPDLRFDFRRNWQIVRALLRDPEVEVQWIFIQRDLATRLLQQGLSEAEDPALLARAAMIIRQPSDSEPHDDHMHVRVYCDAKDRNLGCIDRGPDRWWKKRWKYMGPPFGRSSGADTASALQEVLHGRIPVSTAATPLES